MPTERATGAAQQQQQQGHWRRALAHTTQVFLRSPSFTARRCFCTLFSLGCPLAWLFVVALNSTTRARQSDSAPSRKLTRRQWLSHSLALPLVVVAAPAPAPALAARPTASRLWWKSGDGGRSGQLEELAACPAQFTPANDNTINPDLKPRIGCARRIPWGNHHYSPVVRTLASQSTTDTAAAVAAAAGPAKSGETITHALLGTCLQQVPPSIGHSASYYDHFVFIIIVIIIIVVVAVLVGWDIRLGSLYPARPCCRLSIP